MKNLMLAMCCLVLLEGCKSSKKVEKKPKVEKSMASSQKKPATKKPAVTKKSTAKKPAAKKVAGKSAKPKKGKEETVVQGTFGKSVGGGL